MTLFMGLYKRMNVFIVQIPDITHSNYVYTEQNPSLIQK